MQIRVHEVTQRELHHAIDRSKALYGVRLAARLYRRFELAGELLMRQPEIGTPAAAGARKFPLRGFPYTLVYRVEGRAEESIIHILALSHQSRKPDYWVRRR